MRWFGESWGAPCCETGEHVATPVGQPCLECDRPVVVGDQGFVMPMHTLEGHRWVATHVDCMMRSFQSCETIHTADGERCLTHDHDPAIRAMATALKVATATDNRAVACACGVTYLTGAAQKDELGRPRCIACGKSAAPS